MTPRTGSGRGGLLAHPGRGASRVVAASLALACAAVCAACSGSGGTSGDAAGAPHAGHYAVATPQPQVTAVPHVAAGGYQLVSAGDPVTVSLPDAELTAQVSGPDVALPTPAPGEPITGESAPGVLTLSLTVRSGHVDVPTSSFLGLDEKQEPIELHPDTDRVVADPEHPATVHLSAQFDSGHTTLTWQPLGRPLITWDFMVEID